nr:zinc finger, CCHC-type [Tanacetum cinerariifolium]GFA11515.1 zinc finger, CCHC-type [Tanacetum cinerariifolium]
MADDKTSNSELVASAKVMADAVMGKETDTGKIAGAAADVIDAARKDCFDEGIQYLDFMLGDRVLREVINETTATRIWTRTDKLKCFLCHSEDHLKRDCPMKKSSGFGRILILLMTRMGRIKVINGCWVIMTEIKKKNCVYTLEAKVINFSVQKHGGSKQVGLKQFSSKQVGFKQLGHKQVGFKQLGPGVETGVHRVQVDKRVWFEVELQGAQGNREAEMGANITVTGVPGQKGAEGGPRFEVPAREKDAEYQLCLSVTTKVEIVRILGVNLNVGYG